MLVCVAHRNPRQGACHCLPHPNHPPFTPRPPLTSSTSCQRCSTWTHRIAFSFKRWLWKLRRSCSNMHGLGPLIARACFRWLWRSSRVTTRMVWRSWLALLTKLLLHRYDTWLSGECCNELGSKGLVLWWRCSRIWVGCVSLVLVGSKN